MRNSDELDQIMKDSSKRFIKVRDSWHKNRSMVLSADRLNILISTKGTDVAKAKVSFHAVVFFSNSRFLIV